MNASRRRGIVSASCFCLALALIASAYAAPAEPGPEADGKYTCTKLEYVEKTKQFKKIAELGTLELQGGTYRSFRKDNKDKEKTQFAPFTANADGNIKWSKGFVFVSHLGDIISCTYSVNDGKPSFWINYSDHHYKGYMSCGKKE